MTQNKQQRPMLIASFSALFAATHGFCAPENSTHHPRIHVRAHNLSHRVFLNLHNAPVDITVDKGPPLNSENPNKINVLNIIGPRHIRTIM
jgi:hypothetical protein